MEHFYYELGENWFDYSELYKDMVDKFPDGSNFVEVGVWKGRSACFMAVEIINSGKNIKFHCVDNWEYTSLQSDINENMYNNLYSTFLKNIEPVKHIINPIKELSWEGAKHFQDESLDFIFIDAAHDYESVKKDITSWYPKLKKGGVIAGHDFGYQSVGKAVFEFFNGGNIKSKCGCWIFQN